MLTLLQIIATVLLASLAAGSLLNLSRHPHWFVRGWDFPRVQIVVTGTFLAAGYGLLRLVGGGSGMGIGTDWLVFSLVVFLLLWHGVRILPFTPLAWTQVHRPEAYDPRNALRVVVSNVKMTNRRYARWLDVIEQANADLLILLEVDQAWLAAMEDLSQHYPYDVRCPQDNCYGMAVLSRLPIIDHQVRFLVAADVPSIDAIVQLRSDRQIRVIGVHPRPPEPIRGKDSSARDAELVLYGRLLRGERRPVIIAGDLNDVAWSPTTRLFLKLSQLLDPRRGRGFYNTFHAQHRLMRFPLDHLFHSQHFRLLEIRRLDDVGSDHFPMLIELQCNAREQPDQNALAADQQDHREAKRLVRQAEERGAAELPSARKKGVDGSFVPAGRGARPAHSQPDA